MTRTTHIEQAVLHKMEIRNIQYITHVMNVSTVTQI